MTGASTSQPLYPNLGPSLLGRRAAGPLQQFHLAGGLVGSQPGARHDVGVVARSRSLRVFSHCTAIKHCIATRQGARWTGRATRFLPIDGTHPAARRACGVFFRPCTNSRAGSVLSTPLAPRRQGYSARASSVPTVVSRRLGRIICQQSRPRTTRVRAIADRYARFVFRCASGGVADALVVHFFNEPAHRFGAGRQVVVGPLAAQLVELLQPRLIDAHFKAAFLSRLVRHGRYLRIGPVVCKIRLTSQSVNTATGLPAKVILTCRPYEEYCQGINHIGVPMKSLPTLAAAAALFLGFSAPASAGDGWTIIRTIGHWQISSTPKLCDASGSFPDGTRLEFSINYKGVALISVVNPKWSIPKGDYEVVTQVDRAPVETFTATGRGPHVMWDIPLTEESINLLSYGRTLRVTLGQTVLSYDLALSEAAWKAVAKCAAPMLASANPFAGAPPAARAETPASTDTPSNPFRRL